MENIIKFENVSYKYPLTKEFSIKNMSFNIEKGKFYGIIGENGSGKTTLLNIIRGFCPSFYKGELSGKIYIDEKDISQYTNGELALKIGYVFQNPFNQISGVKDTVFEEVAYGLENFGIEVDEIVERVEKIMIKTNILDLSMKNPFDLSGGQQQRVALASILVLEPEILVIDEPTSQLDPESTKKVFEIIKDLKNQGKTVILVEHKIDLMAEFADEIIVVHNGEILIKGDKRKVFTDEKLEKNLVQIPIVTKLFKELRNNGLKIDEIPLTVDEAVNMLNEMEKV